MYHFQYVIVFTCKLFNTWQVNKASWSFWHFLWWNVKYRVVWWGFCVIKWKGHSINPALRLLGMSKPGDSLSRVKYWIICFLLTLRNSKKHSHRSALAQHILVLYLSILALVLTNLLLSLIQNLLMFNYSALSLKKLHFNRNTFNWLPIIIQVQINPFLFYWNYQDPTDLDCFKQPKFLSSQ